MVPFIPYRPQLSVHVVSLLLCFFLLVFPCAVSSGFIVVLPRKPGKVTVAAVIGCVKSASWLPHQWRAVLSALAHFKKKKEFYCFWKSTLNNYFKKDSKEEALHCGFATCKQVSPSSYVPAVICLVLSVTNCTMWSRRQWHGWSGN